MAQKKKKKIRSHVKRLKMQQKTNPVSPEKYKKRLRIARRKDFFRAFWKVLVVIAILIAVGIFGANYYIKHVTGSTVSELKASAEEIAKTSTETDFRMDENSFIYSADGTQMAELSEADDATYLTYKEIPSDVINAFISVEDRTFWDNPGVDFKSMARVLINYVKTRGQVAEGASTITQQLARTEYLTQEKTISRKIKEIFLAQELAQMYSKKQIMEFYCNTCCFANGIYGIEDAAQTYFGIPAKDLTLSQAAYLCAIPNRPEYYNPLKDSSNAITRRDKILKDMLECGFITQDEYEEAVNEEIVISQKEDSDDDEFYNYEVTYAINCAVRYLMKADGFSFETQWDSDADYEEYSTLYSEAYDEAKHKLYTGGYKVTTTIDLDAQDEMQDVLDDELSFSEKVVEDTGIYELQGAMTVIDNNTGKVIAIIGGRSQSEVENTYSLNRAYQGYAQPGSSFKPIAVYAPALDSGDYTASSKLKNIDVDEAKESTPSEISEMYGDNVSMRRAVSKSINGCAYWLFNEITPEVGLSYVTKMNFSRIMPDDYNPSAALGGLTRGVTTVEMANAYATLENHGEYTQTDCISSIIDNKDEEIYEMPETTRVYGIDAADSMTDMLMGVITSGTASSMDWYSYTDIEAAGKTGTTNDNKAGWFCGYTPYYTIAVWVGCDNPTPVDNLQGATYPAYIWKSAMLALLSEKTQAEFDLSVEKRNSGSDYSSSNYSSSQSGNTTAVSNTENTTTDSENTSDNTAANKDSQGNSGINKETSKNTGGESSSESGSSDSGSSGGSSDSGSDSGSSGGSSDSGGGSSSGGSDSGSSGGSSDSGGGGSSGGDSGGGEVTPTPTPTE